MDSSYLDLVDNNTNLSNLLVGSIALGDGEIVVLNDNELKIKLNNGLSDTLNITDTVITINNNSINLKNNIDLIFDTNLNIKTNNYNYISLTNNLINLNSHLNFSQSNSQINFKSNFTIGANNKYFISCDNLDIDNPKINLNQDIHLNSNNPKIIFDLNKTLEITNNSNINLLINNLGLTISGKVNDNLVVKNELQINIDVNSIFNVTNLTNFPDIVNPNNNTNNTNNISTLCNPISKKYLISGITQPNEKINFNFINVFSIDENTGQFTGRLNIISRTNDIDNPDKLIQIYNIDLWTLPDNTIEYLPNPIIPINNNFLGDGWIINNISLNNNTIVVECFGSSTHNIVWGLELNGIAI